MKQIKHDPRGAKLQPCLLAALSPGQVPAFLGSWRTLLEGGSDALSCGMQRLRGSLCKTMAGWGLGWVAALFSAGGLQLPNCDPQPGCGPALPTIGTVVEFKGELQASGIWFWGRGGERGQDCP